MLLFFASTAIIPILAAPGAARFAVLNFLAYGFEKIAAKEQQKVEQGEYNGDARNPCAGYKIYHTHRSAQQRKPFHFERDNKKQQYLKIGIKYRKRKKQRQVEIVACAVACEGGGYDGADHAKQIVYVEFKIPPGGFQRVPDQIIKIQRDQKHERAAGLRNKNKGDQPPNLPLHHRRPVQRKQIAQADNRRQQIGKVHHRLPGNYYHHQIGNTDSAIVTLQFIKPFHGKIFLSHNIYFCCIHRFICSPHKHSLILAKPRIGFNN